MPYVVYVDDNFEHGNKEKRRKLGEFGSAEAALAAARGIVDGFLDSACEPAMTAEALYQAYTTFGKDPFIVSDDPACTFSAWDYAKERCQTLCPQAQPANPGSDDDPTDPALRGELEATYNAVIDALKRKDPTAFLAAVHAPPGAAEGIEEGFAEMAESLLEMTPELPQTTFVAVKAAADDLAGYYYIYRDPHFANVFLAPFVKAEGSWRLVLDSPSYSFEPEPDEDVVARARELIETEDVLQLDYPAPPEAGPDMAAWDMEVQAFINCMAYDYEVTIAVNGTPLGFTGGQSYSGLLLGVAPGGEPADPAVLQAGDNELDVEYRKTDETSEAHLTIEILAPPDRPCLRLVAGHKPSGTLHAAFRLPADETEAVEPVEISDAG